MALAGALYAAQGVDVSTLPPGEERTLFFRVCSECHGVEDVTTERRTPVEWRGIAADMLTRGAQASDDDLKTIVRYLSRHVGHVNVNRASADDLRTVLELSQEQAEAVVAFRTRQGEFRTTDDVKKVPGVDGRAIEERRDRIVFSDQ